LKLCGAKIGKNVVIETSVFYNFYINGFKNFEIGNNVYIGPECIFDLANRIVIEDDVTVSARVNFVTHLNVGFSDHPLIKKYPRRDGNITVKKGSFIGTQAVILDNVVIESQCFIGALSLVNKSTEKNGFYAGIPAKRIKENM
jgi:acetyltransferase-like isoleucine patch superfamily enzyme